MYCSELLCAEYTPCTQHAIEYEYEVESCATIWSDFTSLASDTCEKSKHKHEFFGVCTHFVAWKPAQDAFTFKSLTMNFVQDSMFWCRCMICSLCLEEICDEDELVINLSDMCEFHEYCLNYKLRKHNIIQCPGCDKTKCKACWKCSY